MLNKPTPEAIAEAGQVTPAYARMLLAGSRRPSLVLALTLYDKLQWQCGPLSSLNKREIEAARKLAEAA